MMRPSDCGWQAIYRNRTVHVVPIRYGSLGRHVFSSACFCRPREEQTTQHEPMFVHFLRFCRRRLKD